LPENCSICHSSVTVHYSHVIKLGEYFSSPSYFLPSSFCYPLISKSYNLHKSMEHFQNPKRGWYTFSQLNAFNQACKPPDMVLANTQHNCGTSITIKLKHDFKYYYLQQERTHTVTHNVYKPYTYIPAIDACGFCPVLQSINVPVPMVHFTSPTLKQHWPYMAPC
jgi:hypothetical protein